MRMIPRTCSVPGESEHALDPLVGGCSCRRTGVRPASSAGQAFAGTCAIAAALVLSAWVSVAHAEPVEIAAGGPASIEVTLWCWRFPDAACRRRAAEAARAHCRATGAKARFVYSGLLQR